MAKQRKQQKPSDAGLLLATATVLTFGLWLLLGVLWAGEFERRERENQWEFTKLMIHMRVKQAERIDAIANKKAQEFETKPVVLKPLASNSKSSRIIAIAAVTPECSDVHDFACVISHNGEQYGR